MSDKKRSYQKPDIRFHDQPHNTDGMVSLGINRTREYRHGGKAL